MRPHRFRLLVIAALYGCISASGATTHASVSSGVPTQAIWRIQEFDFYFRAERGRFHSCSSLRTKISGILEAVGAGSVLVNISCSRDALVNNAFAHIAAATPMHASPENVAQATTFDTEQQMVARLREIPLPTPETIERFPAEWRKITVTKVAGIRLGPEDCDLLHDLHKQVLPHIPSVRVVRASFACSSSELSAARPILVVEALVRRMI